MDLPDAQIKLNRDGRGATMNWAAILAVIAAAIWATILWKDQSAVVAGHTETLSNLKLQIHHIDVKVDAVLLKNGLDPAVVVKQRDGEDATTR
jgi:hypothetical protein